VLGALLSLDWGSRYTPPPPRVAWKDIPWHQWIGPGLLVGFFLFILVWSGVRQVLYGPLPVTRALMNWLGL
jgi:hypothetical protein